MIPNIFHPKVVICKSKLNKSYDEKRNNIRMKRKCGLYEYGEKSRKFFLNIERKKTLQKEIRNLLNGKDITD